VAGASPLDPHLPSFSQSWTEGWYHRITTDTKCSDHDAPRSLGVVFGYTPRGRKSDTTTELMLLLQHGTKPLQVLSNTNQDFDVTSHGCAVTEDPNPRSPPNFKVASKCLRARFKRDRCSIVAEVDGVRVEIRCEGKPVPYGPHGESPDAPFEAFPTPSVHWYVQSLATRVSYRISTRRKAVDPGGGIDEAGDAADGRRRDVIKGCGWMHVEKDWGERFPHGWIWAEGVKSGHRSGTYHPNGTSTDPESSADVDRRHRRRREDPPAFALAGAIAPSPFFPQIFKKQVWLLGVRVRDLNWRLHPWDPTIFKVFPQPCGARGDPSPDATLRLLAIDLARGREVELFIKAPKSSFSELDCPCGDGGFRPLSHQSFAGAAKLNLYTLRPGRGLLPIRTLIHSERFEGVALEFGGSQRCGQCCGANTTVALV